MGLTRGKVPGLLTALYLTLALSSLVSALQAQGRDGGDWELALLVLTFPLSFLFVFLDYLWRTPWSDGYHPWFLVWLFLVFTTANACTFHHVSRKIFRED